MDSFAWDRNRVNKIYGLKSLVLYIPFTPQNPTPHPPTPWLLLPSLSPFVRSCVLPFSLPVILSPIIILLPFCLTAFLDSFLVFLPSFLLSLPLILLPSLPSIFSPPAYSFSLVRDPSLPLPFSPSLICAKLASQPPIYMPLKSLIPSLYTNIIARISTLLSIPSISLQCIFLSPASPETVHERI